MRNEQEHIIASLAILMVNWDKDRNKDYLYPFSEMLAEVISQHDESVLAINELQVEFQRIFGLKLPTGIVKSLLRRLEKRKLIRRENRYYTPNREKLRNRNFSDTQAKVLEEYDSLIDNMVEYFESEFSRSVTQQDAEDLLEGFLAEHQVALLNAMLSKTQPIILLQSSRDPTHKYMVGSFITHISQNQGKEFKYLETVLKGMMLVNVLYLPDNKSIKKRWTTSFYFDTPFLIEALGYQGKTKQELRGELLSALKSTGAKMRCFTHNVEEVRSILFVCLNIIESGNINQAYGRLAFSVDFMMEEGYTPSDILLELQTVENNLNTLGIEIRDKPEYVREYVIDEDRLETLLSDRYSSNANADRSKQIRQIRNDIDSVASIHRLRKGKSFNKIEDCKAIFVTHNAALLRSSHDYFDEPANTVTHCLADFTVANLLWLTRPDSLPDMPRKQIIADAYAATQPDPYLWKMYVKKIEQLQARREIKPDDYYVFRHTQEARNSLMEITQGSHETLTEGTVQEILRDVKIKFQQETLDEASRKQAELQSQADARTQELTQKLENEQRERQELFETQQTAAKNREERSRRWAKPLFTVVRFILGLASILFLLASSPLDVLSIIDLNEQTPGIQFVLACLWLALLVFFIWELKDGKIIRNRIDDWEHQFAKWIEKRLEKLIE